MLTVRKKPPRRRGKQRLANPNPNPFAIWVESTGKTYTQLGQQLYVDPSTIGHWVYGIHVPSLERAFMIDHLSNGAVPAECWLVGKGRSRARKAGG